jgi:CheY-like chemotaxis protein
MAFKRALVVDDSRSARVAMKIMLEEHGLGVEFAESGEEGLEFLKKNLVDVIFMDHTMPGMDGLEAVVQLKANPRTATIPVMMYTTKEGEVYVSQARALGAVGVLPKEVHPGVLFNMLLELGLVTDRRAEDANRPVSRAEANADNQDEPSVYEIPALDTDAALDADAALEQQALGMSLQAVVTRILEDQHLSLRSDILFSHREFARQVADEIFVKQQQAAPPPVATVAPAIDARSSGKYSQQAQRAMMLLALVLLVPAMVLGMLLLESTNERDQARAQLREMDTEVGEQLSVAEEVTTNLIRDMNSERRETLATHLSALQWALNQGGYSGYHQQAFDSQRADTLEQLLTHLRNLRFEGTVRMTSHLGEFCLMSDAAGALGLARPAASVSECVMVGHPLDDSSYQLDRLTPEFADFLNSSPLTNGSGIRVTLAAYDRLSSSRKHSFPASIATAGEWNEIAQLNNRVEIELLPE